MTFTDGWKTAVRAELEERGARSELARWLSETIGGDFNVRKVQLAKILNGPAIPEAEIVLAINEWRRQQLEPARPRAGGKKRRKPAKKIRRR